MNSMVNSISHSLLFHIAIVLIIVGLALYLINHIPIPDSIKAVINLIVVISVILWILSSYGLIDLHKLHQFIRMK